MSANRFYNEKGESVKFTTERNGEYLEIVTEKGVTFRFSGEVGVPTAITCLIHKTLFAFLTENFAFDYVYELKVTKKK